MKTTKIGNIAVQVLNETNSEYLSVGEFGLLHDIYDRAIEQKVTKPLKNYHPLNVFQRVLNGIEKDDRFEKSHIYFTGIHKNSVRSFKLKSAYKSSKPSKVVTKE